MIFSPHFSLQVFWFAFFIAYQRKPNWDQDHLDIDEKLPTIYYDPDDPETRNKQMKNLDLHHLIFREAAEQSQGRSSRV